MLLEESLKEFLFECEVRKYTWKTIRGYRNGLNFLVNYLMTGLIYLKNGILQEINIYPKIITIVAEKVSIGAAM